MEFQNNDFIVSARKYRPLIFSDVIGQESVCSVISNSIKNKHIPSGYLFTGIRGTGKTTLARIIAKTINCSNLDINDKLVKFCQECDNCISSSQNNHPDIIEIDAASHTGVDDVRLIIESAEYKPMQGYYKVFIIDEVHMLSKSAFNALLKIVEEPPKHVLFILATTEINKVPLTISSRCQKFALKRLKISDIIKLLERVLKSENIQADPKSLEIIAYKADGSARDSLSLLDQAISLSYLNESKQITFLDVKKMIGIGDNSDIIGLMEMIANKDIKGSIELLKEIQSKHSNLVSFFEDLVNFIGSLIKSKTINEYQDVDFLDFKDSIDKMTSQIKLPYLMVLWQLFSDGIKEIKDSHNMLLTSEILIIKAIYTSTLPSLPELISLVEKKNSNFGEKIIEEKKNFQIPVIQHNIIKNDPDFNHNQIKKLLLILYKDKKFDLYYYLFNEVELEFKDDNIVKIASTKHRDLLNKELETYIKNIFGSEYKVNKETKDIIVPYKDKVHNGFKNSEMWKKIKTSFSSVEIEDILINLE